MSDELDLLEKLANLADSARAEGKKLVGAHVAYHDGPILLPDKPKKMTIRQAITALERQEKYENETININKVWDTFWADAAIAFYRAMQRKYGFVNQEPTPTFWGPEPPELRAVKIGVHKEEYVPLGRFSVPGIDGKLEAQVFFDRLQQKVKYSVSAVIKRFCEDEMKELIADTDAILQAESIYRGKAIRVQFTDEAGSALPLPQVDFLDLSKVDESQLIYSKEIEEQIRVSIWTPIEQTEQVRAMGVSLKRGAILAGRYGTGKTLGAYVTAKKAEANGWTFIYVSKASDLRYALRMAAFYAPVIIFCEDIDRIASGSRDAQHDELLNLIDGIDSKNAEIMIILTSNDVESIGQGFLRPGRLDAVIPVSPPDNEAVERLVRLYGGTNLDPNINLASVGLSLQGQIPAVIAEVVKRSKLAAIAFSEKYVTETALLSAARSMQMQLQLLEPKAEDRRSDLEKLGSALGYAIGDAITNLGEEDEGVLNRLSQPSALGVGSSGD